MTSRRSFLQILPLSGVLLSTQVSFAQSAMLDEKDAQAVALGYVADAARADKTKYPKFAPGQGCSSCALYQGKPSDAGGACTLFAGKQVPAKAWCSAYAKKV
jgi:hypothetical protein